jgi:hypothetical protein
MARIRRRRAATRGGFPIRFVPPAIHPLQTLEPPRADAPLQLVFRGECLDGHDPQAVRRVVASALELDAKRAARLFSGKRVVLRRQVSVAAAQRHVAQFALMGAVLRTEPSKPRPASVPTKRASARRARAPWRRPLRWAGIGALFIAGGLVLGLALGLLLVPDAPWHDTRPTGSAAASWSAANAPHPPPPAAPAATPSTTSAADGDVPQDMTAEAVREYQLRYLGSPNHKAFAISPGGARAWHAGAASENEARARAIAGCMAALRPGDDGCRVIDADGNLEE